MEFGLLPLSIGSDYAYAYPFLGSLELPLNAPPRLREDVCWYEGLLLKGEHCHVYEYKFPCTEVYEGEARCYALSPRSRLHRKGVGWGRWGLSAETIT